jgi:hypothetical protein
VDDVMVAATVSGRFDRLRSKRNQRWLLDDAAATELAMLTVRGVAFRAVKDRARVRRRPFCPAQRWRSGWRRELIPAITAPARYTLADATAPAHHSVLVAAAATSVVNWT